MELGITPINIFAIGPVNVTSAHMALMLVTLTLIVFALWMNRTIDIVPNRWQVAMEAILIWFEEKVVLSTPERYRAMNLYFMVTIFLMMILANFFAFFPVLSQITYGSQPLFTTPTAHMSLPLVMALFMIGLAHMIALLTHPFRHIGNFIKISSILKIRKLKDIGNALIEIFLGLMDIIGEIAKVVSVSARLFGNMVSGDLMSKVIIGLSIFTSFLAPVPFYALGFLAAMIQAVVFSLLAGVFLGSTLSAVENAKAS